MSLHAVKIKGRYYILKDITKNGKHSTTTVEKLGTAEEIMAAHDCDNAKEWARQRALELDMKDREAGDPEGRHFILARDNVRIPKGEKNSFNVGYLPLQKIYYDLRFPSICNAISKRHSFDFDLDASAFLLGANGKCLRDEDFVFYNNLNGRNGAVVHQGDNLTGEGDGDDEVIIIDFANAPKVILDAK